MQTVHQSPPSVQAVYDVLADATPGRPYHYKGQTFIGAEADAHRQLDAINARLGRPAASLPSAERIADLEALGYDLGLEREDSAKASPEWSSLEAAAFDRGVVAGRAEWNRRLDIMFSSSDYDDAFPASRVTDADLFPGGWG